MRHEAKEFLIVLIACAFLGFALSLLEEHIALAWIAGGLYMAGIYTHRLRMHYLGEDHDTEMSKQQQVICALCKAERELMERRMELEETYPRLKCGMRL